MLNAVVPVRPLRARRVCGREGRAVTAWPAR